MNSQANIPVFTIQRFEPAPNAVYSIESTAQLGNVSRRMLALLCRHGLLTPVMDPECGGYYFNDEAIRRLQRIEYLYNVRGVNLRGIKIILDLQEEMDRLHSEVDSLRSELEELTTL